MIIDQSQSKCLSRIDSAIKNVIGTPYFEALHQTLAHNEAANRYPTTVSEVASELRIHAGNVCESKNYTVLDFILASGVLKVSLATLIPPSYEEFIERVTSNVLAGSNSSVMSTTLYAGYWGSYPMSPRLGICSTAVKACSKNKHVSVQDVVKAVNDVGEALEPLLGGCRGLLQRLIDSGRFR